MKTDQQRSYILGFKTIYIFIIVVEIIVMQLPLIRRYIEAKKLTDNRE